MFAQLTLRKGSDREDQRRVNTSNSMYTHLFVGGKFKLEWTSTEKRTILSAQSNFIRGRSRA